VAAGRFGFGGSLNWGGLVGTQTQRLQLVRPILPGMTFTTGVIGLAMYIGKTSITPFNVQFYDAIYDAPQVSIEFTANGVVSAYRGGPTTNLLGSSYAGAYYFDEWFYLEAKATIGNPGGALEVRINTVPILAFPTVNTQATGRAVFDSTCFATRTVGLGQTFAAGIDDVYVLDDAGSVNNTFLGNVRVKTQFTAGAGDLTQFAIGGSAPAATNWQSVLNKALDDTKFVSSPTVGQEDLYAIEAILTSAQVHGVQVRSGMRQDDSTQRVGHNVLKMGGVSAEGGDHYLNQSYTHYMDIFELNPSTGLGMTGTQLNAGQIGPKVAA
jgi:hypothetical protein